MALKEDLSVKIDASGLAAGLGTQVTSFQGDLNGITAPALDGQAFSNAASTATAPAGGLTASVSGIAAQLPGIVGQLPLPTDVLRPIMAALELVESVVTADLENQFRSLGSTLTQELSGISDEGFLGVLLRVADLFGDSPQVREWKKLFQSLTDLAGVRIPQDAVGAPNLTPGVAALLRLLGGLMAEHTIVSEAERLAKSAAAIIDTDHISASTDALSGFFRAGGPSVEEQIAVTDPANAAQVDTAVAAVRQLRLHLEQWSIELTRSLAFGEATLTYMDIPALQTDLNYAAAVIRQADTAALDRLFASIAGALGNVVPPDVLAGPQFTLEQFFAQIEGRIQQLAAKISSFSPQVVSEPLTHALDVALDIPNRLGEAIEQVKTAIAAVLERVRAAVAALPLDAIRNALRDVLAAVANALTVIGNLVTALENLLTTAADAFQTVLDDADQALTGFRDAVQALFHEAAQFVDSLHLDQVVGQIADGAKTLADAIGKASMKPYFDTAAGAIQTAADVVEKVPFELLPDSMEQEVVDALRPIKTADVDALKTEIEGLLQIGPDGKFALRPEIEAAAAQIQQKFDDLIAEIRKHDPRTALAQVDAQLAGLGEQIRALSLQIDLSPVRDAIQQVRSAVQSLDPDIVLQPLRQGFDQLVAKLDEFSPDALVAPIETRWNEARQHVLDLSRLPQWLKVLDDLTAQAKLGLDFIDPAEFGTNFDAALSDALSTLDRLPHLHAGSAFGSVVAAIYQGSRLRVEPLSLEPVLEWLGGKSGTADLLERAGVAADVIRTTGAALRALDLPAAAAAFSQGLQSLRAAAARLPAGPGKDRIVAELDLIDLPRLLAPFHANHARFFTVLEQSTNQIAQLTAAGFSEVDDGVRRLRAAFAPMSPATAGLTSMFSRLGISGFDVGLGEVVRRIVAVAPPSRLVSILMPLFNAVHDRLKVFVDAVATPLRGAIQRVIDIFDSLTLTPLREGLTNIHGAIVGQITQFHPDKLLAEPLAAFQQVRTQVLQFDPVSAIQSILDDLSEAIERVLSHLDLENLLEEPLHIYDEILALLAGLRPADLLRPVYDQLDRIASEVDEGLAETVTSFHALQDALPDHVGSTSLTASVSVS
jgi:phage-related protein